MLCNNATFSFRTIPYMPEEIHESALRLYKAAKELKQVEGKSSVAKLLNESPQTLNNWEGPRGISAQGAIKAQAEIGCDANWLLTGRGHMTAGWPFPKIEPSRFFKLGPEDKGHVQGRALQGIEECEKPTSLSSPARAPQTVETFSDTARHGAKKKRN